jgi:hypothetical protein
MVRMATCTIALTEDELDLVLDGLWELVHHRGTVLGKDTARITALRKRLVKLDLTAKGWGPAENALADLLPEST